MKILTIVGTRPEIIRLSVIMRKLDEILGKDHLIINTNQNFDNNLNKNFWNEFGLRDPDLDINDLFHFTAFRSQFPSMMKDIGQFLAFNHIDKILILGDTNSGLAGAIMGEKEGIPVYHLEAGNRCYDETSPEEINRRIIDHIATVHLPYTQKSRDNLLREGIADKNIYVVGNPIYEVLNQWKEIPDSIKMDQTTKSSIKKETSQKFSIDPYTYYLATIHRKENMKRAIKIVECLEKLDLPVIISTHPTLHSTIKEYIEEGNYKNISFWEPFALNDFLLLESHAKGVITDSGTVQEECAIFGIPCFTFRRSTERPETIEYGCNVLVNEDNLLEAIKYNNCKFECPPEYKKDNVSDTVVKLLMEQNDVRKKY